MCDMIYRAKWEEGNDMVKQDQETVRCYLQGDGDTVSCGEDIKR